MSVNFTQFKMVFSGLVAIVSKGVGKLLNHW